MENIFIDKIPDSQFVNMKEEWNALLEQSATNELFLVWEWMYSWWDVFKNGGSELYLLRGKSSTGETIGIAPFYLQQQRLFGNFKIKIIRFCSSVETYPDHLDIIAMKEYEHLFSEAVLNYLVQHDKDWDLIKLEGVHENAMIKKYLSSVGPKKNGVLMKSLPSTGCPYLVLDKTFEGYLSSFSPKKRQTLLRKRRILMDREKAVFRVVQCDEEPDKYIRELFALHEERARQKGIKTTFSGEEIYKFHSRLVHGLLREGKVVLAFLYKEFDPLVSYYCIKHGKKYYYYQAGLSHEGEKRSAGAVLFSLIIENAFKEGYKEFDFLRGSEEYKFYWTKNCRQDYSITVRKDDFMNKMTHYCYIVHHRVLPLFQRIYKPILDWARGGSFF